MLARLGEFDVAKRSLFAMQEDSGLVGHMIFWKQLLPQRRTDVMQARPTWQALRPHMSALVQPPLAGIALHALYEACGDRVYLGEMYARVTIISPFESGMDWKSVGVDLSNFLLGYDLQRIRSRARFLVKDAGFNAIYAWDLECMEKLAPLAGDDPAVFAERRRRVLKSMLGEPGAEKLRVRTPTIFFPLALAELDAKIAARVLEAHFDREHEFSTPVPIPSVELRDASFFPS